MTEIIKNFITSDRKSIPLHVNKLSHYESILKDMGYEMEEIGETNGWSVDFWYYFKHKHTGNKLCLAGSLWYGDYTLTKVDNECRID